VRCGGPWCCSFRPPPLIARGLPFRSAAASRIPGQIPKDLSGEKALACVNTHVVYAGTHSDRPRAATHTPETGRPVSRLTWPMPRVKTGSMCHEPTVSPGRFASTRAITFDSRTSTLVAPGISAPRRGRDVAASRGRTVVLPQVGRTTRQRLEAARADIQAAG